MAESAVSLESQEKSKIHLEGITVKKTENFSEWYRQLITKAKLIEYYDVSGCYVILPNAYTIWEHVMIFLDQEFKRRGVRNAYFPLFITQKNLNREQTHIADFTPEVAWVTKSGQSELEEPIAVRPTSECAIYSVLPNIIRSYHDLPMKLNQWCNVVRWEFKSATPFIRSREFLWNEGHSAFATQKEAEEEVQDIIHLYQQTYKEVLCVPTILGRKTEKEKFAGADSTYTVEAYIPEVGRGVQGCTAHCLGQNFSKMFEIKFDDRDRETKLVYQNSWGFTTRSIGVTVMTHGDDKGMIYPPKIAPIQIVIVPIWNKTNQNEVKLYGQQVVVALEHYHRVHYDLSDDTPGAKYNRWELIGVPIRVEIGPRDMRKGVVTCCRRDTGEKMEIKFDENLNKNLWSIMEQISENLYQMASERLNSSVSKPENWNEFKECLENKKICLIPWCGTTNCEEQIKEETTAKSLCLPMEKVYQLDIKEESVCCHCSMKATSSCLFAKSY